MRSLRFFTLPPYHITTPLAPYGNVTKWIAHLTLPGGKTVRVKIGNVEFPHYHITTKLSPMVMWNSHITTLPHYHQTVPDGNVNSSVNHLTTPGNVPYPAQIGKVVVATTPPLNLIHRFAFAFVTLRYP